MHIEKSSFEIVLIHAGWFDVLIHGEEGSVSITNSYYMGNDAPQIFLKNLGKLARHADGERWLCWHDEPGAYILHIDKHYEYVTLNIFGSKKEAYRLPYEGVGLSEEVDEKYFRVELPFTQFAAHVLEAFDTYRSGEKLSHYETQWMPFPQEEYHFLEDQLKVLNATSWSSYLADLSRLFLKKHRIYKYQMKKVSDMDDREVIEKCHSYYETNRLVDEWRDFVMGRTGGGSMS